MAQIKKVEGTQSQNYLSNLLQKNSRTSLQAQSYITIKNTQISERLMNGQQIISNEKSQIKISRQFKNYCEIQNKTTEQQNQKIERKILIIQNSNSQIQRGEKKYPPKPIADEDRLKFVNQKIKQKKLLSKRKQKHMKQLQQKQKIERQKQETWQVRKQQQIKQKRNQQARKKIEDIQKRKEQRILQNKKTDDLLKEKSNQKILAHKIHERFLSSQNLLLDERKKMLAELRKIHKPMDRSQLQEHARKFQLSRLERSRNKQSAKVSSSQKLKLYYRSMFHDVIQRQSKQRQEQELQQKCQVKQFKQKSKKYAEQVKINFRPQIDSKKRQQVQKRVRISSLIHDSNPDNRLKGMEYLQFTKDYGLKHKKGQQQLQNGMLLMKQEAYKTQKTDYLAQVRKSNVQSRLKRSVTSAQDFIQNVQKKNIPIKQKQQKIIQFAENLQRKARQKQKLIKGGFGEQMNEEVDKLYISAIQAKLKALQT